MNSGRLALILVALAAAALLGWWLLRPAPSTEGPLAGAAIGGPFALTDQNGRPATDRQFAGRYRLMYFGYTFCPDVCPLDVQELAAGLRAFEQIDAARAARVAPIFVTVDPGRDTPAALKAFVAAFHPRLTGLTGTPAELETVKTRFKVFGRRAGDGPDYLVDHSAITYLFGPGGEPIAFVSQDQGAADIARMLETYVR